jgi:hypothetical protein
MEHSSVASKVKRSILIGILPGQDPEVVRKGAGSVCIHLFVQDAAGSYTEPSVFMEKDKKLVAGPARGRLACDSKRSALPTARGAEVSVTNRTDDPRAVTCPKCKASSDYKAMMQKLEA